MTTRADTQLIAASLPNAGRASNSSTVVALCGLAMVAEGFDTYSMSYAAPLIIRDWGASPTTIGVLLAASVVASALGTMAIGPIADRHGRKPCMLAALILFGIATLMTAHVTNMIELTAARLLSSLALGASVPIAIALASESVELARRGTVAAAMSGCIALGIVASGLSAAAMVPEHGWQSLMYVGGLFALLLAFPIFLLVEEPLPDGAEAPAATTGVRALFGPSFRHTTFTALFAMGTIYAVSFFFNFWMPTLLLQHNPDMREVALANALAQTMSLVGALFAGRAMDRYGLRALALTFAAAALVLTAGVGLPGSFGGLVLGCCCICLFMNGAFGGALAAPVHLYPHELRATALGFTIGVSRLLGGSLGPLAGGWLLASNLPTSTVAIAFGPALLLSAGVLFLYTRRA